MPSQEDDPYDAVKSSECEFLTRTLNLKHEYVEWCNLYQKLCYHCKG